MFILVFRKKKKNAVMRTLSNAASYLMNAWVWNVVLLSLNEMKKNSVSSKNKSHPAGQCFRIIAQVSRNTN